MSKQEDVTLKMPLKLARELMRSSTTSKEMRELITANFPKEKLSSNVMDRIDGIDDVIEEYRAIHGELPEIWSLILAYKGDDRRILKTQADVMLDMAEVVINEGWEADYTDRNQSKHTPYFEMRGSSFVFRYSNARYVLTHSNVGSRRSFRTEELSIFFGTKFIALHNLVLLKK